MSTYMKSPINTKRENVQCLRAGDTFVSHTSEDSNVYMITRSKNVVCIYSSSYHTVGKIFGISGFKQVIPVDVGLTVTTATA